MALTVQVPTVGQANSTEAIKVTNSLTNLSTWANGQIPGTDLAAAAAIARSQMAGGFGNLGITLVGVNTNAVDGKYYLTTVAGLTITLPAPTLNATVGVLNDVAGVTTIARSGGAVIAGVGTNNATSVQLGTSLACMVLQADGTNWFVVSGQQDTGWVALTLATNVITGGGYNPPAARLQGDTVRLKGVLQNNTGGSIGSGATWATVPAGLRPAALVIAPNGSATSLPTYTRVDTGGLLSVGIPFSSGTFFGIDGVTYSIS